MTHRRLIGCMKTTVLLAAATASLSAQAAAPRPSWRALDRAALNPAQARTLSARLPIAFEAVPGSKGGPIRFYAAGSRCGLWLAPTEATLALPTAPSPVAPHSRIARLGRQPLPPARLVRLLWQGANPHAHASGLEPLPGKIHRYVGPDPRQWDNGSALFARALFTGVYPGIDLIYYGNQQQFEYDCRVAAGADPSEIRLAVRGARRLSLDAQGGLLIHTPEGTLRQPRPRLYQERAGRPVVIAGGYVLRGKDEVGFQIGRYDRRRPLVIDPTLVYSTYLGGGGADEGDAIAVDGVGMVYLTGVATVPTVWPTTPGALQTPASATIGGAFVTKLDLTKNGANALVYSTYLGTNSSGAGIAVDATGNIYVTGTIGSPALPVTPGAFQPSFAGRGDAFAAKLSPTGALIYATYLGGGAGSLPVQGAQAIAADPAGNAYITGFVSSDDGFPTTPNAFQRTLPSPDASPAFVLKLDPAGKPVYSTFLGVDSGWGFGIAADAAGDAYVTGGFANPSNFPTTANAIPNQANSAFVTKFSPTGTLLYSTLLNGDQGNGIAVDGAQNIYVTGATTSSNFPVTPGAFQSTYRGNGASNAFVAKISATGALVYATYLGGSGADQGNAIAVDAAGDAFITGQTSSPDYPVTRGSIQMALGRTPGGQPTADAFVTILEPGGKFLAYSTFLGGSGDDTGTGIALDSGGNIDLVGITDSPNFRTAPGALQTMFGGDRNKGNDPVMGDAFVARISLK